MGFLKIKRVIGLILTSAILVFLSGCQLSTFFVDKQVKEVYELLDAFYYKPLDFKLKDVSDLEDLFSRLDEPYTYIYEANTRTIEKEEAYDGLGITISDTKEGLFVSSLNLEADFEEKIYVYDVITKVNGQALEGLSFTEKQAVLTGKLGDQFDLEILRGTDLITITLMIKEIPMKSTTYRYDEKSKIGYIDINRFSNLTATQFAEALQSMESLGLEGLIIDVRDNGGGYLVSVVQIIQLFLSGSEPFLYMVRAYDNRITEYKPYQANTLKDYPVSLLINENSASASEVLAQALNIGIDAPLIGNTTYGKDVYQVSYRLNTFTNETYLNMTQGYWLTKNNESVSGGIKPTIEYTKDDLVSLGFPSYLETFKKEDSSDNLIVYQHLLNEYDNTLEDINHFSTFDELTYDKLKVYQEANGLSATGELDLLTMFSLIDLYHQYLKDPAKDELLNLAYLEMGRLNAN